jgi:hypothetical protein
MMTQSISCLKELHFEDIGLFCFRYETIFGRDLGILEWNAQSMKE